MATRTRAEGVEKTLKRTGHYFDRRAKKFGPNVTGVGIKNPAEQQLRFQKLCSVIAPEDIRRGFSVNDVGSGYGALFHFLNARYGKALNSYTGYDVSEEMIAHAKRTVRDRRADFLVDRRPTRPADFTFLCGIFNMKFGAADNVFKKYVKETVSASAAVSRKGIAFCCLSTYVDWKHELQFYADPLEFFDFCKKNISRYVVLLHDYPLYDWTLVVRKSPKSLEDDRRGLVPLVPP